MEHHRLKPMQDGYDQKLFNELYKKTTPLRKKLAWEIDARKFGVDYQEILSWFDVKFIHAFSKYEKTEPERLLGYIINSLTTYKYRIMRSSYQAKYHNHASQIDITELYNHNEIIYEDSNHYTDDIYLTSIMKFMRSKLNDDAIFLMEIELTPPPYIVEQMADIGIKDTKKIPADILVDFMGYPESINAIGYIRDLRLEIKYAISLAKKFFIENPPSMVLA